MYSKFSASCSKKKTDVLIIFNLEIPSLVVFFGSATSQNVSLTAAASGSPISVTTPITTSVTTGNGTNNGEGGADAVSMSYYVFALTLLGAYLMQFMEH